MHVFRLLLTPSFSYWLNFVLLSCKEIDLFCSIEKLSLPIIFCSMNDLIYHLSFFLFQRFWEVRGSQGFQRSILFVFSQTMMYMSKFSMNSVSWDSVKSRVPWRSLQLHISKSKYLFFLSVWLHLTSKTERETFLHRKRLSCFVVNENWIDLWLSAPPNRTK